MTARVETVVLDSQGLSAWVDQDRKMLGRLKVYSLAGAELVVCANTIVEVSHGPVNLPMLNWALSRVRVEAVDERAARGAAELLKRSGLHGHKYAIDATVAELALRQRTPVVMLTSDIDDMAKLCGDKVGLIGV